MKHLVPELAAIIQSMRNEEVEQRPLVPCLKGSAIVWCAVSTVKSSYCFRVLGWNNIKGEFVKLIKLIKNN